MGLGLGEIILILILAFVVVGPDDLPKVARGIAKAMKQAKILFADIRDELEIETELKDVKDDLTAAAKLGDDVKKPIEEINLIKKEVGKSIRHP